MRKRTRMVTVAAVAAVAFGASLAAAPPASAGGVVWAKVQRGDSGLNVRAVQALLRDRGWNGHVTGHFRYGTVHAVRAFQDDHGIGVTGIVDRTTWPELAEVVKRGHVGPVVKVIQRQLKFLGFYHAVIGGHFGPRTQAAVRRFQHSAGLPETGVMNVVSWRHLIHSIGFPSCLTGLCD